MSETSFSDCKDDSEEHTMRRLRLVSNSVVSVVDIIKDPFLASNDLIDGCSASALSAYSSKHSEGQKLISWVSP